MSTTESAPATEETSNGRIRFGTRPTMGIAEAGKTVAEDLSALVKAEIALAKAEVSEGMKAKATGVGAFGAAAVFAWLGLQGLLITLGFALATVLPGWAASLIVTALLLAGAGIAVVVGKSQVSTPVSLDTTKANVEEDVAWAKSHLKR